jgi:hypothetical protein
MSDERVIIGVRGGRLVVLDHEPGSSTPLAGGAVRAKPKGDGWILRLDRGVRYIECYYALRDGQSVRTIDCNFFDERPLDAEEVAEAVAALVIARAWIHTGRIEEPAWCKDLHDDCMRDKELSAACRSAATPEER